MRIKIFILKSIFFLSICCSSFNLFAQEWLLPGATEIDPIWRPAQVGIGMSTPPNPNTLLHLKSNSEWGGSVLFEGYAGNTPTSGAGNRLMWIPQKSAFRAGNVSNSQWDDFNIGIYSTATGNSTVAAGVGSTAMGYKAVAFAYASTAFGFNTIALGQHSFAVGANTEANGNASNAFGNSTLANAHYSTAFGTQTKAYGQSSMALGDKSEASGGSSIAGGFMSNSNGYYSLAMGNHAKANARSVTAIGEFNVGSGNATQWIPTDPILEVGIGNSNQPKNALTVLKNGNVGINTANPQNKLHISNLGWGGNIDLRVDGRIQTGNQYQMGGVWLNQTRQMFVGQQNSTNFGFWSSGKGWNTLNINRHTGNIGINTTAGGCKLTVNGSACKPGGGSWSTTSDRRLKNNIKNYEDGLEALLSIKPVSYQYNNESGHDTEIEYIGVIAQELKEVAPYMVGSFEKDGKKYLNVDNSAMTYMLINAVKEQQTLIEDQMADNSELRAEIEELKAAVQSICNNGCGTLDNSSVINQEMDISDYETEIILNQNQPNPFNHTTSIHYSIPEEMQNATLIIYDLQGKQLRQYDVEAGKGIIEIDGGELQAGMYFYSLIVNEKVYSTLRMVLTD